MKLFIGVLILAASGIAAKAQDPPRIATPTAPALVRLPLAAGAERGVVKNSPFSADAISESVQTLADGNRIVHSSTSKLYRNSEGRSRRETLNGSGGIMGTSFSYGPGITIMDPVGGSRYLLDEKLKVAEQSVFKASTAPKAAVEMANADARKAVAAQKLIEVERMGGERVATPRAVITGTGVTDVHTLTGTLATAGEGGMLSYSVGAAGGTHSRYESKTEQLGVQNIEGVEAEGTRTTTTIPAGAIGNERPIETVYERWYSKELQIVVMSKTSDPRSGEQTYRLTNIVRSEPDPALFAPPAGYKIVSDASPTYRVSTPAKAVAEKAASPKAPQPAATYVKNKP